MLEKVGHCDWWHLVQWIWVLFSTHRLTTWGYPVIPLFTWFYNVLYISGGARFLNHQPWQNEKPWNFCGVFWAPCWGHPITWAWKFDRLCYQYVRTGRALEGKFWNVGVLRFFFPIGRCFCWQSGAWRVTLPQTTLCFCWSCFGWYVIEKQKTSKPWICVLFVVFDIFNILTPHNVRTMVIFNYAIFWGLKLQGKTSHSSKLTEKTHTLGWKLVTFLLGLVFLFRCVNAVRFRDDTGRRLAVCICLVFQRFKNPSWNQDGVAQGSEHLQNICKTGLTCLCVLQQSPLVRRIVYLACICKMGIPKPWLIGEGDSVLSCLCLLMSTEDDIGYLLLLSCSWKPGNRRFPTKKARASCSFRISFRGKPSCPWGGGTNFNRKNHETEKHAFGLAA